MLMDLKDACKISHLGIHCLGQILYEVDLPKAIEFSTSSIFRNLFFASGVGSRDHVLPITVLKHAWGPM